MELFFRGDSDLHWFYLLWGFFFGFRAIDSDCALAYNPGKLKKKSNWESNIIEEKFRAEVQQNYISPVETMPTCIHDVFVVPKGDGGGV